MHACLAVTCHLHFWQNDRDFLRATVVTRGWNGYRNKSQHRKSTLEKKILPPFQQGFEPATFQSRVRRSNHWAIPAPPAELNIRRVFYVVLAVGWRNLGCRKTLFGVCVCCAKNYLGEGGGGRGGGGGGTEVPKCSLLMLLSGVLSSYVAGCISRCMLGIRDTTVSDYISQFCACMHVCRLVCGRCGFSGLFTFLQRYWCRHLRRNALRLLSKSHWVVIGTLNSGQEHWRD